MTEPVYCADPNCSIAGRHQLSVACDQCLETPEQAIRDFLKAVDRGYLGPMPKGFDESAFVQALRRFQK